MDGQLVLSRLCMSLQLLAAPAQTQLAYFPDFVCKADEIALDYDLWFVRAFDQALVPAEQIIPLAALNDYLGRLSRKGDTDFWTEEALTHDAQWDQVRAMAKTGLEAMGWSVEAPPPSPDVYIHGAPRQ